MNKFFAIMDHFAAVACRRSAENRHTPRAQRGRALWRTARLELLEPRALLSGIAGAKFNDLNANGLRDAGDPGLPGWTIYLDQNRNGQREAAEAFQTTGPDGSYLFTGLAPGNYFVAEEAQAGWRQTCPQPGATVSNLQRGQVPGVTNVGALDFNISSVAVACTNSLRLKMAVTWRDSTWHLRQELTTCSVTGSQINISMYGESPGGVGLPVVLSEEQTLVISGLASGVYSISAALWEQYGMLPAFQQTWWGSAAMAANFCHYHIVTLGAGQNAAGRDFGNVRGVQPVVVPGTTARDTFLCVRDATDPSTVALVVNGGAPQTCLCDSYAQWQVAAGEDDDALTVDFSRGKPLPCGGLIYDGGAHGTRGDSLLIAGASAGDALTMIAGQITTADGLAIAYTGIESLDLELGGATATLVGHNAVLPGISLSVNAGTLLVGSADALPDGQALTIGPGGAVVLGAGLSGAVVASVACPAAEHNAASETAASQFPGAPITVAADRGVAAAAPANSGQAMTAPPPRSVHRLETAQAAAGSPARTETKRVPNTTGPMSGQLLWAGAFEDLFAKRPARRSAGVSLPPTT